MHSGCKDVQVNTNHNTQHKSTQSLTIENGQRYIWFRSISMSLDTQFNRTNSARRLSPHVSVLEYFMSSFHLKWHEIREKYQ